MDQKKSEGLLQIFGVLFVLFFVLALWSINTLLSMFFFSLAIICFVIIFAVGQAKKTRRPVEVKKSRGIPW